MILLSNQRLLLLADRLTGKVYAKLFENLAVNFAEHNAGVNLAAP